MGAWLGKLQCKVTGAEASLEIEKSCVFGERSSLCFAVQRSTSLWDVSVMHKASQNRAAGNTQKLKAPFGLSPKAPVLKAKSCTCVLSPQALSRRKLCLGETHMGHLLILTSFGVGCTCHARGSNFRQGLFHPSAIASVGTHQEKKRDL